MEKYILGSLLVLLSIVCVQTGFSQIEGGISGFRPQTSSGAYYYLAKPGEMTMLVNIWGAVHYPGRYEIPISTNLVQLVSYAGGPTANADLGDVIITRSFTVEGTITKNEIEVDLEHLSKTEDTLLLLYAGDTIFLDESTWTSWIPLVTTAAIVTTAIANVIIVRDRLR